MGAHADPFDRLMHPSCVAADNGDGESFDEVPIANRRIGTLSAVMLIANRCVFVELGEEGKEGSAEREWAESLDADGRTLSFFPSYPSCPPLISSYASSLYLLGLDATPPG